MLVKIVIPLLSFPTIIPTFDPLTRNISIDYAKGEMFSRSYGIIYTSLVIIYPPRIFNFVFRELFLPTFNVLLFYDELASLVGSNCFRHVSNCSR